MTNKTDTPKEGSKTAADFEKMPSSEEFASLDANVQNQLLEKFADVEDTPNEESTPSTEERPEEETPKDEATQKEPKKETPEKPQDVDWEKRYKDLQREYTKIKEDSKPPKETPKEKRSKFDQLKEANPKAKDFFDSLEQAIDERLGEKVQPISERLDNDVQGKNEQKFLGEIDEFLAGELKELEPELEGVIADKIGSTKDDLIKAARKNPNLFSDLKKELLDKHLDKVVELKSKVEDPQKRNQEIKDTGVSGKPKTAANQGSEDLDLKSLRGLGSYSEMKKALDKQGAVDVSAKPRGWQS